MARITENEYEDYMIKTLMVQDIADCIPETLFGPEGKIKKLVKELNQKPNELTMDYFIRLNKIRTNLFKLSISYENRIKNGKVDFFGQTYSPKFFNYYDQDGNMKRSITKSFDFFRSDFFISTIDDIIKYKKTLLTI